MFGSIKGYVRDRRCQELLRWWLGAGLILAACWGLLALYPPGEGFVGLLFALGFGWHFVTAWPARPADAISNLEGE